MARTKKVMLLFFTGFLILASALKIFLATSDMLDKILAIITVLVFFIDQITD